MDIRKYLESRRKVVEKALREMFPSPAPERQAARLEEAMRYSVLAGGKRLRPVLCIAATEALGGDPKPGLPAACALELVHTYSLIHDDLPCMDDDDLRRGKPTNHKVYGEATALLAGDSLLARAFEAVAAADAVFPAKRVALVHMLASCSGAGGLTGGQAVDLASEGVAVGRETLEYIHAHKTASLITTAVLFGAVLGGATRAEEEALAVYGNALGMAFQITDDLLDAEGDEAKTGKRLRKDDRARKATYPALFGLERARAAARDYIDRAVAALGRFGAKADPLREIARSMLGRER